MKTFRIYVTNISQANRVLVEHGYNAAENGTYVEVLIDPSNKMDVITLLNQSNIVLYDIEEV